MNENEALNPDYDHYEPVGGYPLAKDWNDEAGDEATDQTIDETDPLGKYWDNVEPYLNNLPDLVSTGDIARMAGVHVQAVSNWKQRYCHPKRPGDTHPNPNNIPKFPDPIVTTGAGPLYARTHVEQWLAARERAQA